MAQKPISRIGKSVREARSKQTKRSQTDPNGAKKPRKVIPMAEAERIAQMHVLGKTKRQIARETGHGRRQVAKIIEESDQPAYVAKIRGQFVGLGDIAIATLKAEMEKGN